MRIESHTSNRTRSYARVLGPYLVIAYIVAVVKMPDLRELLVEFHTSLMWPWVLGSMALLGGIAIVAFHNLWRDPAAVLVSLLGWLLVVRGIVLIGFPDTAARWADTMMGAVGAVQALSVLVVLMGLFLTAVGWMPLRNPVQPTGVAAGADLPHAA